MDSERLKDFKTMIGQFHEEMKSNNVTDLVVWLDCKIQYGIYQEEQYKQYNKKSSGE